MPRIPPPGKRIQPGERRNPKGSSAKARALKNIRTMTPTELAKLTSLLLDADVDAVKAKAVDTTAPFIEMLSAKMLWDCYRKGDVAIYRAILDRVVGRPKESATIEVSGPNGGPISTRASEMDATEIANELAEIHARREKVAAAMRKCATPEHALDDADFGMVHPQERA